MSDHKPTCATVVHEEQDKSIEDRFDADVQEYTGAWPAHCVKCRGWGLHTETYALSVGTMTDICLCECVEGGVCPRCGVEPLRVHDDAYNGDWCSCVRCGWTESKTEGLPSVPQLSECDCWSLEDVSP